jgi:hypothetical protein
MVKKAMDGAAVAKRTATNKKAADAAVAKKATGDVVAVERATMKVATQSEAESSPASVVRAKRAAVLGGSTPHAKRPFHGSGKPLYVEGFRSCSSFSHMCILFHWDSSLCSVSSSSGMPTLGGSSTRRAPREDQSRHGAGDRGPQDSLAKGACGNGAPTPNTATATGAAASKAVANDGSPAPDVGAVTSSMVGEETIGIPAASTGPSAGVSTTQPQMGAATTSAVVDDDPMEEPEVVNGHPFSGPRGCLP